jgi:hypothetical protein
VASNSRVSRRGRDGEGRPPHEPTDDLRAVVLGMTINGVPIDVMCKVLKLDDDTLRKHYGEEILLGRERAGGRVAGYLFAQATGQHGNTSQSVTAAIFYLKTRQGWKESVVLENPDGTGLFAGVPDERVAKLAASASAALERGSREKA